MGFIKMYTRHIYKKCARNSSRKGENDIANTRRAEQKVPKTTLSKKKSDFYLRRRRYEHSSGKEVKMSERYTNPFEVITVLQLGAVIYLGDDARRVGLFFNFLQIY